MTTTNLARIHELAAFIRSVFSRGEPIGHNGVRVVLVLTEQEVACLEESARRLRDAAIDVEIEREACAQVAETTACAKGCTACDGPKIAAAIRARGKP